MLEAILVITTLLCALVAGLVFAFSIVAMPGINGLPDREFIRAFQAMDGVIQNNQPLFLLAWVGSALGLIGSAVIGVLRLDGLQLALLIAAAVVYLVGVQVPTVAINIPLNNALQRLDVDGASEEELARAREAFEPRWNRWNRFRTVIAVIAVALLLILLLQL